MKLYNQFILYLVICLMVLGMGYTEDLDYLRFNSLIKDSVLIEMLKNY